MWTPPRYSDPQLFLRSFFFFFSWEVSWNIEVEGIKTHCLLRGQSLSVLLYLPPISKLEKTAKNSFALSRLAHKFAAVSRSLTP